MSTLVGGNAEDALPRHLELRDFDPGARVDPDAEEHRTGGPCPVPVAEVMRREQRYRVLLATADGIGALLATLFTACVANRTPRIEMLLVPIFVIMLAKIEGLYDRDDQVIVKANVAEWRTVLRTVTIASIGIYLAWRIVTNAHEGGGMRLFLFLTATSFVILMATRTFARSVARTSTSDERCLLIGNPALLAGLAERLERVPGVALIGTISEASLTGSLFELSSLVEQLNVHRLVISPSSDQSQRQTLHLIQAAKFIGVRVSLQPSIMTAVGGFALLEELDGMTLLGVPRFGLSRSSMGLKRTFDFFVAGTALMVLWPLMALMAAAIKLNSPGPVLFRQTRIGRDGRPFQILKFRSMVDGAEALKHDLRRLNEAGDGLFKIADDPRITSMGRHLRATHLDELPQLLNVLRGEMSLVGPRPLVLEEDSLFTGRDRQRLKLTPGMTGPWQVRGPMHTPIAEMAMLDYRYASNWSIWQDLDILLQTARRVVSRAGH